MLFVDDVVLMCRKFKLILDKIEFKKLTHPWLAFECKRPIQTGLNWSFTSPQSWSGLVWSQSFFGLVTGLPNSV